MFVVFYENRHLGRSFKTFDEAEDFVNFKIKTLVYCNVYDLSESNTEKILKEVQKFYIRDTEDARFS